MVEGFLSKMFFERLHRIICTEALYWEPSKTEVNELMTNLKRYELKKRRNSAVFNSLSCFVRGTLEIIRHLWGPRSEAPVDVEDQVLTDLPTTQEPSTGSLEISAFGNPIHTWTQTPRHLIIQLELSLLKSPNKDHWLVLLGVVVLRIEDLKHWLYFWPYSVLEQRNKMSCMASLIIGNSTRTFCIVCKRICSNFLGYTLLNSPMSLIRRTITVTTITNMSIYS